MIVKVGSLNQKGYNLAYTMRSKEDFSVYKWVFKTVKLELEKIVNEKIACKIKIHLRTNFLIFQIIL